MQRLIPILALCWAADAGAVDVEFGAGLDLVSDLGDPGMNQGASKMNVGPALRVPVRVGLHSAVSLRADAFLSAQKGQDRIEWAQYNGVVAYQSEDHWSMLTQLGCRIGPEISPWSSEPVALYGGTSLGLAWARHWHSFHGPNAVLLDPGSNDIDSGGNIDPYTDQLAPSVGVFTGVRFKDVLPFAIEVELGYNVAFMREAQLKKARPALQATRTAYGYNPIRLGVNAVFPM
jgi:hypothetical protein